MNSDRVILIQGNSSNWYEQAIFIIKPSASKATVPVDLVAEAEKIIKYYVAGNVYNKNCTNAKPAPKQIETPKNKNQKNQNPSKPADNKKKKTTGFDFMLNFILLLCVSVLAGVIAFNTFL